MPFSCAWTSWTSLVMTFSDCRVFTVPVYRMVG
jgi:hypothetical protein